MANIRSKQDFIIFLLLIIATLFLIKFQLYDVEQPSMGLGISYSFLDDVDKYCNQNHELDGEENDLSEFEFQTIILKLLQGSGLMSASMFSDVKILKLGYRGSDYKGGWL